MHKSLVSILGKTLLIPIVFFCSVTTVYSGTKTVPPNLSDNKTGSTAVGYSFNESAIDTLIMNSGKINANNSSDGDAFAIKIPATAPANPVVLIKGGSLIADEIGKGNCSLIKVEKDNSYVEISGGSHYTTETSSLASYGIWITGKNCNVTVSGGSFDLGNEINPTDKGNPDREGHIFRNEGDGSVLTISGGDYKTHLNFPVPLALKGTSITNINCKTIYTDRLKIDANGYVQDTTGFIQGRLKDGNIISFKFSRESTALLRLTGESPKSNVYVSDDNGDDKNDGTKNSPYKTINRAVAELYGGGTINLFGGTYQEVVDKDGIYATADNPLVIKAMPGEKVRLDGSVNVKDIAKGNWERYDGDIYRIKLTQDIWQLWVDDEIQTSARWPNATWRDGDIWDYQNRWASADSGWVDSSTNSQMVRCQPWPQDTTLDLAKSGVDVSGAVAIQNFGNFNSMCRKVKSHTPGTPEVYHEYLAIPPKPPFSGIHKLDKLGFKVYFFEGSHALIDKPTEWAYDKESGYLYLMTENGVSPEDHIIKGKVQTYFFNMENSEHIQIKDVEFFGTTVSFFKCQNITVENCDFNYPSYSKRMLGMVGAPEPTRFVVNLNRNHPGGWGTVGNHSVKNCTFYRADGDAITMHGTGNIIDNCLFKEIDYSCVDPAYNNLGYEVDNKVGNDGTVHTYGSEGVLINRVTVNTAGNAHNLMTGKWNDTDYPEMRAGAIKNCHLERCGLAHIQDGANIHIWQFSKGHADVSNIWTHDSYKTGVRSDGGENSFSNDSSTFKHIVAWDRIKTNVKDGIGYRKRVAVGVGIHGKEHTVDHVLAMDSDDRASVGGSKPSTLLSNCAAEFIGTVSPNVASYTEKTKNSDGKLYQIDSTTLKGQLRDATNWDFRPVAGSRLIDGGNILPGVNDGYKGSAPDMGAYEYGDDEYWIPGYQSIEASTPVPPMGGENVKLDADLMYLDGYKALSHNVYLGTDPDAVMNATTTSPEFQGNKKAWKNICTPKSKLLPKTRYFWRVDALGAGGTVTKGNLWYFSTDTLTLCTLTYAANANGVIKGNNPQILKYGKDGTSVSAIANSGYSFSGWSDGSKENPRQDLFVKSSSTYTASFVKNKPAGIVVSDAVGTVSESGGSAKFTIVLTTEPKSDVTINLSSSDETEGKVSPSLVTFHTGNWDNPITITVTGVDDNAADGDVKFNVVTSSAVSKDNSYNGINPKDLSLTNIDNDQNGDPSSITVNGLDDSDEVFIHATNGWKGSKVLTGNGKISGLFAGTYLLSIQGREKRTELLTVKLSSKQDTTITVALHDAVPYIFNGKVALKGQSPSHEEILLTGSVLTIEDLDGDGDNDIIAIDRSSGKISYYQNNNGYAVSSEEQFTLPVGSKVVAVRCINNNGDKSLYIALNSGEVHQYFISSMTSLKVYSDERVLSGFELFDFNDDAYADMMLGNEDGTFSVVSTKNDGSWENAESVKLVNGNSIDVGDYAVPVMMDYNGDGFEDLIAGNGDGEVVWFKGDGTTSFVMKDSLNSGGMPLVLNGIMSASRSFNTTLNELPLLTITDENGGVYELQSILLGDVDGDGKAFLTDFSLFTDAWRSTEGADSWNVKANFDVTPNRDGLQEISLADFTLFVDSWRKEK